MKNSWKVALCLLCLSPLNSNAKENAGRYAKISEEVSLFYRDTGKGDPLVFIPGWMMSSDVFEAQMEYFSQNYRVIAFDPRSQGRSSLTMENNNYTQHGSDLAKLLDYLQLKDVVLVTSTWGSNDLYAYTRLKGTDNLKAVVLIDSFPKTKGINQKWACANCQDWGRDLIQPLIYNRSLYVENWAQSMVEKELSSYGLNLIISQSSRTPTYAALEMAIDAIYADYQPEEDLLLVKKIPKLELLSEEFAKTTKSEANSETKMIGKKSLAFWEHPEKFNSLLENFLNTL